MRKLKRSVERYNKERKILTAASCVALSVALAFAGPAMTVSAASPIYGNVPSSVSFENAKEYNVSDRTLIKNGEITINIDEDGSYVLKGTNSINNSYVDVKINVAKSANVNLLLDDLHIINDDTTTVASGTSIPGAPDGKSPITVEGTANVYIKKDSSIEAVANFFTVNENGKINFVKSEENNATLTCYPATKIKGYEWADASCGTGIISFLGANVEINTQTKSREVYNGGVKFNSRVYIEGTGVKFGDNANFEKLISDNYKFDDEMNLKKGTRLDSSDVYYSDAQIVHDTHGNPLVKYKKISGITAGGEVVQINNDKVSGIKAGNNGTIDNIYLREGRNYVYVKEDSEIKRYIYWNSSTPDPNPVNAYLVKLIDSVTNEEMKSYYIASGEKVSLLEDSNQYDYSYYLEGNPSESVTSDSVVISDMNIMVTKTEKEQIKVYVDGTEHSFTYGQTLESKGLTSGYIDSEGNCYSSGTQVTGPMTLYTINLTSETINGKIWFKLNSADNVKEFADLVNNNKATNINGYLNSDVTLNNDFCMIGSSTNPFMGTFDGNGHTVTLNLNKDSEGVGLFGYISKGATIKNVVTKGSVSGKYHVGALVGKVLDQSGASVTIENCINEADVVATENFPAGIIGGIETTDGAQLEVYVKSCANRGNIYSTRTEYIELVRVGGIVGYGTNKTQIYNTYDISNASFIGNGKVAMSGCYSVASEGNGLTKKSLESFESGEVAYLINKIANTEIWHQTCGQGLPELSGQTVYAGYNDCDETELSYANTEFLHTEMGHHNNESYSYEEGTIHAGCIYCADSIDAEVIITEEELTNNMKGVTVDYSEEWEKAGYPDILIKYSDEENGDYTETLPNAEGTWYLKAFIGEQEISVSDTYTVNPASEPEENDPEENDPEGTNEGENDPEGTNDPEGENNPEGTNDPEGENNTEGLNEGEKKTEGTNEGENEAPQGTIEGENKSGEEESAETSENLKEEDNTSETDNNEESDLNDDDKESGNNDENKQNDIGQKTPEQQYYESLQEVENEILSLIQDDSDEKKEIVYTGGEALPQGIIKALAECPNAILDFRTTYEGKEYHFRIEGGFGDLLDENIPWFGPFYLAWLFGVVED